MKRECFFLWTCEDQTERIERAIVSLSFILLPDAFRKRTLSGSVRIPRQHTQFLEDQLVQLQRMALLQDSFTVTT